ncbi:MAG: SDR family oxidoreductase [Pseudomonadales bacterium]
MTNLSNPPPYPASHNLLDGRKVIITAAAGTGIGFAAAKRCMEEGAEILMSDIHKARLEDAAQRLESELGQKPATQLCNVTDQPQVGELFAAAATRLGGVDLVINNAGLGSTANLVDMTDDEWHQVLDVTLNGTFRMTRAAMQAMADTGGVIVNNASVMGWRAQIGQAHYAAAKAGVMALTRCAALEGAANNIRVNAVAPSLAMHPFLEKVTSRELLDALVQQEAYGRAAETWEVANVIVFLASDYSTYMTGETVSVSNQRA